VRRGDLPTDRLDPTFVRNARRRYYAYPAKPLAALVSEEPAYGTSARSVVRLSNDQPRYIRITDYGDDGIVMPHEFVAAEDWSDKHVLIDGDLLFARSGATVGKTYLHSSSLDPAVFAGYCIRFRMGPDVLPEFVYGFTKTGAYASWVAAIQRPAGQPNINKEEFKGLELPVPPLDVQRRLVAELDAARTERDRALVQADELISGFEEWALKAMGVVATQPKRRSTFAVRIGNARNRLDPFNHLPEFIEIERAITSAPHARLGDLVTFSTDIWSPEIHPESTFQYIEISGVDRRRGKATASTIGIGEAPSRARMAVRSGDLIVSLTRPHHGSIALLGDEHQACVASTGFAVIRYVSGKTSARFLWAVLRMSSSLRQMLRRASGGNYPAITQDELANVLVPVPDIITQQRVVDEAIRRSEGADALEAQAESIWQQARKGFEQHLLKEGAT
jgi:type I restriction enzyme S subunit